MHEKNVLLLREVFSTNVCIPLGTQRCCEVESTSMTLIKSRNNVMWDSSLITASGYYHEKKGVQCAVV